jgi:hypothetical protein
MSTSCTPQAQGGIIGWRTGPGAQKTYGRIILREVQLGAG